MKAPLPTVDGVSPSQCWLPQGNWVTVLDFLITQFPHPCADTWVARMHKGEVVTETGERLLPDTPYQPNTRIFYYREIPNEPHIPFTEHILYQDDHLLVVDKPPFLSVSPSGQFLKETLLVRLKKSTGIDTLAPIHRLDRATSGVILFSVNESTRGLYQTLFQNRSVSKHYEAIGLSNPTLVFPLHHKSRLEKGEPFFRMKEGDGEPNSETHISIKKISGNLTHYLLQPVTGKQHQLRVHMSTLGIPILNDIFYPVVQLGQPDDYAKPLQLLAKSIGFKDPITQEERYFESSQQLMEI